MNILGCSPYVSSNNSEIGPSPMRTRGPPCRRGITAVILHHTRFRENLPQQLPFTQAVGILEIDELQVEPLPPFSILVQPVHYDQDVAGGATPRREAAYFLEQNPLSFR